METVSDPAEILRSFRVRMEGEEKSPCTVKEYLFMVDHFLTFVAKPPSDVSQSDVERYREHLVQEKRYSKNSVYLSMRAITYFLRLYGPPGMKDVDIPPRAKKLPSFLNEDEMHRLLEHASTDLKLEAILRLLCYGGLRVGELCHLETDDIDIESALVRVRHGKGDKDRIVVIDESTVQSLKDWLKVRPENPSQPRSLFALGTLTVERKVRSVAKAAGIERRVTPHTLRHTLATTLLRHGLDIRFIQKQLGHASVATTELYTHVDTQALQEAYKATKPKY